MPFASEIHYRRSGQNNEGRAPLILIHGAGGSYLYWPPEVRYLVGEDILAIDLPGHGASVGRGERTIAAYAPDVIGFMDELNISLGVIAGHSMGGAVAQKLSLDNPERVRGLMLVGSGAKLRVHAKLIQFCRDENTYPQAISLITEWAFSSQADQRLVELAGERMLETSASVLLDDFTACDDFDVRDYLEQIEQPTLIICGEEDRMTPLRFSEFLHEKIPNSQLNIIPDAGHMVMLEQPVMVAKLIKGFLNEINSC